MTMCAPPPLPSSRIGDYIPLKTIGTGSTGKVKLARHAHTGQLVALKYVRHDLLHSHPTTFQKVRREIAVLKLIAASSRALGDATPSPDDIPLKTTADVPPLAARIGVMQLLDVYHFDNAVVLVLEHCAGGELFDLLLQYGCLDQHIVLDLFQQLAYALQFCHARGICHRDLKAENILLTRDGRVKLADFGMATTMLAPRAFLNTSCGSPQYCAPEVLLGERYDGRSADVWSLGVVLFAMTTGGLPFDDDNWQRLVAKISAGEYFMPAEVPGPLADVLRSMLVPDPTQRATLDDVMRSPWFTSRPVRADVFVDVAPPAKAPTTAGVPGEPIVDPDVAVLKQLADLGLGSLSTMRRRLASGNACREREYYLLLLGFCREIRAYHGQVDDSSPPSPNPSAPAPPAMPPAGDVPLLAAAAVSAIEKEGVSKGGGRSAGAGGGGSASSATVDDWLVQRMAAVSTR